MAVAASCLARFPRRLGLGREAGSGSSFRCRFERRGGRDGGGAIEGSDGFVELILS